MKKIHQTKYIHILLIIVLFIPILSDSIFVLAEDNRVVETENTDSSTRLESENDSTQEQSIMKETDISETSISNNEAYEESEPSEVKTTGVELFHDFSPPSTPGGGYPLIGEGNSDDELKKWYIKYGLSRVFSLKNVQLDGSLGESVGDTTNIIIPDNTEMYVNVMMPYQAPYKQWESWYGYMKMKNVRVSSQDDAIKVETVRDGNNYKLVVTRLKEDTKTSYNISVTYSGEYPHYVSQYGQIPGRPASWTNWVDGGTFNLDSNTLDISLKATPVSETLRGTAIAQSADLTKSKGYLRDKKLVENVKFGSKELKEGEYNVEVVEEPDYLTIGDKTAKVKVSYNNEELLIDVPVKVEWGNSIYLKNENGESILSLSVQRNHATPTLFARRGIADGIGVISNESGKYLGIELYRPSSGNYSRIKTVDFNGDESKETAYTKFSNTKVDNLEILKIYHKKIRSNSDSIKIYTESEESIPNQNKYMINDDLYLLIKSKGFEVLNFNQFQAKEATVKKGVDKSYLDSHISDFIDMRGLEQENISLEFKEYPDTKTGGTKKGIITAKQKINSSSIKKDYEVNFEVIEEEINVETRIPEFGVGIDSSDLVEKDFITKVSQGDKEILSTDYNLVFVDKPDSDELLSLGEYDAKIKVTLKESGESKEIPVSLKVNWGDTIAVKNNSLTSLNASVSLLHNNGKPFIKANKGNGLDSKISVTSRPSFRIKRDSVDNTIVDAGYNTVNQMSINLMHYFNSIFSKHADDLQYGDVMEVYVTTFNGSNNWNGKNTFVSRNNSLTLETVGYPFAYYELTKNGYRLLNLNQLKVKHDNEIFIGTSKEELNKNIQNFIEIPENISNKEELRVEFSKVDTSIAGSKEGTIDVYQKLTSGKEFKVSYNVNYSVIDDGIEGESTVSDVLVGSKLTDDELYKLVKNVKIGGQAVDTSKYKVLLENGIDTNYLGEKEVNLRLENLATGKKSEIISSKVNVVMGNTLEFLGFARQSVMGLTLSKNLDGTSKEIYSNWLRRDWKITTVHSRGGTYIETKLMKLNSDISTIKNLSVKYTSQIDGKDNIAEAYKKFEVQKYNYGDILYTYHREGTYGGGVLLNRYDEGVKVDRWSGDSGYFELTDEGFEPIFIDKLSTKRVVADRGSSISDLEKRISEFIDKKNRKNIEVISFSENGYPNLEQEGIQKVKLIVREKLKSGKELEQEYEAELQVNPIVNESFKIDEDNTKIAPDKTTPFEFGTEFQPDPPTFITSENILYKYVGYRLDNGDVIQDKPNKTRDSINLEYVYKKADKYINVTVPTELVFGTFNDDDKISSKEYQIKNNSSEIATKITLESFMKVDSDIKLLGEDEGATNEESARLNLLVDGEPIIKGLNELVSNRDIKSLAPKQTALLGIDGIYYGDKSNKHIVEYKTKLKFKAIEDSQK
ncbi:hypothetical protein GP420_002290 [Enterococcus faecalis]|nr:hypothetical protein [Enterococcus faecalis]